MVVVNRNTNQIFPFWLNHGDENRRLRVVPNSTSEVFSVSTGDMSFYQYDAAENVMTRKYKRTWDDELENSDRYVLIPNSKQIISAPLGNIYDNSISLVGGLPRGELAFSDLLINESGSKVFAGCSNSRSIKVCDLENNFTLRVSPTGSSFLGTNY